MYELKGSMESLRDGDFSHKNMGLILKSYIQELYNKY